MTLPVTGYVQQVEVVVGGTLPRAGFVQPVEVVGAPPGGESLEQARAIGDTFTGGDVYWDASLATQFGRASGEANVDYGRVYFDQAAHAFVFDSTKDGTGTLRPISFQIGGSEAGRFLATKEFLVGATTLEFSDAISIMRRDQNKSTAIYVENQNNTANAGAALAAVGPDGSGGTSYAEVAYFAPNFTGSGFGVLAGRSALISGSATGGVTPNPLALVTVIGTDPIIFAPAVTERCRVTPAGALLIGATAPVGSEKLRVVGDAYISGKLTVLGAMDPTSVSLSDPAAGTSLYFESDAGQTAPVAAANKGRLRYNNTTKTWQMSVDGGAYITISSATSGYVNGGNAFGVAATIGTTDANTLTVLTNGNPWMQFGTTGNIFTGNTFTPYTGVLPGGVWQYRRTDTWAHLVLMCDQDGSLGFTGQGESLVELLNDVGSALVFNSIGSAFPGTIASLPLANLAMIRSAHDNFLICTSTNKPMTLGANNTRVVTINSTAVMINATSVSAFSERLAVNGHVYAGNYYGNSDVVILDVSNKRLGLGTVSPAGSIHITSNSDDELSEMVIDNRSTGSNCGTRILLGNDPLGTNNRLSIEYFHAGNNSQMVSNGPGTLKIGTTASQRVSLVSNNGEIIRLEASKIGFFNTTAAVQQGVGAVTNNVTAGGVDGTIADFTSLTVYATDAAAIRNDIYQLARSVAQIATALRTYGLAA